MLRQSELDHWKNTSLDELLDQQHQLACWLNNDELKPLNCIGLNTLYQNLIDRLRNTVLRPQHRLET